MRRQFRPCAREICNLGVEHILYIDRLAEIKQMILDRGSLSVAELSQYFEVSGETIRRDLEKISNMDARIKKIHGGVYYENPESDMPYSSRKISVVEGKRKIAEACVQFIDDGDVIILDSSTTALSLADRLVAAEKRITVITNGLNIMECIKNAGNMELIAIGGRYNEGSMAFLGNRAIESMKQLQADKAFVSCSGLTAEHGVTDSNEDMACMRRAMLQQANIRYLAVDSNKVGRTKLHKIVDFDYLDAVFTNNPMPQKEVDAITQKGSRVYTDVKEAPGEK